MPAAITIEKGREDGGPIESWPTEPVDRTLSRHQGCGAAVADDAVILYLRPRWANGFSRVLRILVGEESCSLAIFLHF